MATLEAIQVFGKRFRPQILEHEEPAPELGSEAPPVASART